MNVFIDTSAFYAVIDADDQRHHEAVIAWEDLLGGRAAFHTTSYVLIETTSLLQNRIGVDALRTFAADILPVANIAWVDESVHLSAFHALLRAKTAEPRRLRQLRNHAPDGHRECLLLRPAFCRAGFPSDPRFGLISRPLSALPHALHAPADSGQQCRHEYQKRFDGLRRTAGTLSHRGEAIASICTPRSRGASGFPEGRTTNCLPGTYASILGQAGLK